MPSIHTETHTAMFGNKFKLGIQKCKVVKQREGPRVTDRAQTFRKKAPGRIYTTAICLKQY